MKTDHQLQTRARELRKNLSPAERILWRELRGRRFAGYKFRRQQVLGAYILDFYCANACFAIELDGESHLDRTKEDEQRSRWLEGQGIKVIRCWNTQVFDELEAVLELIFRECEERKNLRLPDRGT